MLTSLQTKYFDFKTFVLDVETTGLDPRTHTLLSIGGVLLDEFLNEVDSIELFLKHDEYNIQPAAMAVNKIDLIKHHATADTTARTAWATLNRFFLKAAGRPPIVLAGYNVAFDAHWLYSIYPSNSWPFVVRHDGGLHGTRMIDIQAIAVAVERTIKPKLSSQLEHTALSDARAEANRFRELMQTIHEERGEG